MLQSTLESSSMIVPTARSELSDVPMPAPANAVGPNQLDSPEQTQTATSRTPPPQGPEQKQVNEDYKLLLTPMFAAMTRITDNLFLTGVGGITRANLSRNHIDFVVNITTDAPFYANIESMRLPLEDDDAADMLAHLDSTCDTIHKQITQHNAHVLVHCFAGVSRSATIVIAYLMKYKRMDLRSAFNYCFNLRPVIRPNNGFMVQLIKFEERLFGRTSVHMIDAEVNGVRVNLPHFLLEEHPQLVVLEVMRMRDNTSLGSSTSSNPNINQS